MSLPPLSSSGSASSLGAADSSASGVISGSSSLLLLLLGGGRTGARGVEAGGLIEGDGDEEGVMEGVCVGEGEAAWVCVVDGAPVGEGVGNVVSDGSGKFVVWPWPWRAAGCAVARRAQACSRASSSRATRTAVVEEEDTEDGGNMAEEVELRSGMVQRESRGAGSTTRQGRAGQWRRQKCGDGGWGGGGATSNAVIQVRQN